MRALKFSPVFHRSQSTSVKIVGRQGIKKSKLYVIHAFPPLPDADHTLFIITMQTPVFCWKIIAFDNTMLRSVDKSQMFRYYAFTAHRVLFVLPFPDPTQTIASSRRDL